MLPGFELMACIQMIVCEHGRPVCQQLELQPSPEGTKCQGLGTTRESDLLIVLRARERLAHGEAEDRKWIF